MVKYIFIQQHVLGEAYELPNIYDDETYDSSDYLSGSFAITPNSSANAFIPLRCYKWVAASNIAVQSRMRE